MLKELRVIRSSASVVAEAALTARDAYARGLVEHEPEITDRMLGAIEGRLSGELIKGFTWEAKTFTNKGPSAQEARCGADFMGILSTNLSKYKTNKFFLAQAKRAEPGGRIERGRLLEQCSKMLSFTSAAFVFLYSKADFKVVPASAVVASGGVNPWELYPRAVSSFIELHFVSFLGDTTTNGASIVSPDYLPEEYGVRRALWLSLNSDREWQWRN